ncbi:MAG TPA: urea ABC transporter permease subunit UrtB [Gammaproteobacteria bacterium]|nr:urea ABC transporter permease subunit UrtB [Gammaproteobacteria bacterium]
MLMLPASVLARDDFAQKLTALNAGSFSGKESAIRELAATGHERAPAILKALLEGRLYCREDGTIVIVAEHEDGYQLTDAISGAGLGVVETSAVKRISLNNSLRSLLRESMARFDLESPDAAIRLAAVIELTGHLGPEAAALLRQRLPDEQDAGVRDAMEIAVALSDLTSVDSARVMQALAVLQGSLGTEIRGAIANVSENHPDAAVRKKAAQTLASIEGRIRFYGFVETLFFGLSMGSILVLIAIGLAITFGVMGVINMAHGELMMLGAYTTYAVQQIFPNHIELSLLIAVPAAFLVSGAAGVAIERGVIRFLYGRPLETLLATFGISLILQQLVRTLISAQNVAVVTPQWMSGSWQINDVLSLTCNRLYVFIFAMLVFAALVALLKRSRLGLEVRAVAQNRAMARAVGIRTGWVDALTFSLGSGIAGVAGVALSQLTNVGPNLGQGYIIDSFMVVVFGGVGNLWGTLVGGISLGVANKFLEPMAGAVVAKILVLVFIILFIQKRPRGLFPQKGRAVEAH